MEFFLRNLIGFSRIFSKIGDIFTKLLLHKQMYTFVSQNEILTIASQIRMNGSYSNRLLCIIKYTTRTRYTMYIALHVHTCSYRFISKKLHKYESQSECEVNLDFDIRTSSHSYNIEVRLQAIYCYQVITSSNIFINFFELFRYLKYLKNFQARV